MVRTIEHADDIPNSDRHLRIACAVAATVIIALAWGGFYHVVRATIESDQILASQTHVGSIALGVNHVRSGRAAPVPLPQPDTWLPGGLEHRSLSELAAIDLNSLSTTER